MRPAVLLFAPLLLLPLACTDTPIKPETEEATALFRPHDPGVHYVEVSYFCKATSRELPRLTSFFAETHVDYISLSCDIGLVRDWLRIGYGGDVYAYDIEAAAGEDTCRCDSEGVVTFAELIDGAVTVPRPGDTCRWIHTLEDCTDWFFSEFGSPVKLKLYSWRYY